MYIYTYEIKRELNPNCGSGVLTLNSEYLSVHVSVCVFACHVGPCGAQWEAGTRVTGASRRHNEAVS